MLESSSGVSQSELGEGSSDEVTDLFGLVLAGWGRGVGVKAVRR